MRYSSNNCSFDDSTEAERGGGGGAIFQNVCYSYPFVLKIY